MKALGSLLQVSPVGFRPSQARQLGASDRTSRTATPACISAAIRATVAFPVPTGRAAFPMRVPARREARTAASRSADRFGARTPADRARLSLADVSLTGERVGSNRVWRSPSWSKPRVQGSVVIVSPRRCSAPFPLLCVTPSMAGCCGRRVAGRST